jgi:hypothetical protein
MSFLSWLFPKKPKAPAWEPPPMPAEGWGPADYRIDWDLAPYPYATIDAEGTVEAHQYPPYPIESMEQWRCVGQSVEIDQTRPRADWRACAWSTPIPMEFDTDANGNVSRSYPDWMKDVNVW